MNQAGVRHPTRTCAQNRDRAWFSLERLGRSVVRPSRLEKEAFPGPVSSGPTFLLAQTAVPVCVPRSDPLLFPAGKPHPVRALAQVAGVMALAGMTAGLLGIGGALLFNPWLLQLGVHPQVSPASLLVIWTRETEARAHSRTMPNMAHEARTPTEGLTDAVARCTLERKAPRAEARTTPLSASVVRFSLPRSNPVSLRAIPTPRSVGFPSF